MFRDWEDGALVQVGTVAEHQGCVADVSWSHRRRLGVEEFVAERGGVGVHLCSLTEGTSAVAPVVPSGGYIALVGSPGQHGQTWQHPEDVLGVAVGAGTAGESYIPLQSLVAVLVVSP